MDEPKKMSRKKKILIGLGIYVVVAVIASVIAVNSESSKKTAETTKEVADVAEAAKPANERLKTAVAEAQKNNKLKTGIEKILALYYSEDSCEVAVKIGSYWNEDRLIGFGCRFGLAVAKEVFTRCPEYNLIKMRFYADMQDKFGNESEMNVFNYNIRREIFAKVNFENFSDMVILDYNSMWALAEDMKIAPGILRGLEKIKL